MSTVRNGTVAAACRSFDNHPSRLLDIVLEVQDSFGHVDGQSIDQIAEAVYYYTVNFLNPRSRFSRDDDVNIIVGQQCG